MRTGFAAALRRLFLLFILLSFAALADAAPSSPAQQAFSEQAIALAVAGGVLYGAELLPSASGKVPVALLRADARFSRVIVAGHSEGALIGMLASRAAGADGYVSIAGVARGADEVLRDQLSAKLPPPLLAANEAILQQLKQGRPAADVPPALAALYRPSVQPYLISWFKYVPRDVIATLKMPVLIVQGTSDLQVSVDEARALGAAAPQAHLIIIDGMNHVLKMVGGDAALQQRSYSSPDLPVSPQLVAAITNFVNADLAPRR